jgi:hypothetical protein
MSTPTLRPVKIMSPISKYLVKDIEKVVCPPPPRHKPVKARTMEDRIHAVGQAHARLGAPDPRKDAHGGIDFRIQRQIEAYKKDDAPPLRVKLNPTMIIIFIVAQAYSNMRDLAEMAIGGMIVVAFFFLLSPGKYTSTLSDNAAFNIEDVSLYVQGRKLDFSTTFTTQKNNNCNEKVSMA